MPMSTAKTTPPTTTAASESARRGITITAAAHARVILVTHDGCRMAVSIHCSIGCERFMESL